MGQRDGTSNLEYDPICIDGLTMRKGMANIGCMKRRSRQASDEGDGDESDGAVDWWREDVAQEVVVETSSLTCVRAGYR